MVYEPSLLRAGLASKAPAKRATPSYGLAASDDRYNPRVLPRGFMDDEAAERFYGLGFPRIRSRIREGVGTLAEPRLPSLAIRLSLPCGDRASAREPPSGGHACKLHLLGRGGDRRLVSRHDGARGRTRDPWRQGSLAARPVERPHLPQPPLAERELRAADLRPWQHSHLGAKDHKTLVPAAIAQAQDRCRADVDRRE